MRSAVPHKRCKGSSAPDTVSKVVQKGTERRPGKRERRALVNNWAAGQIESGSRRFAPTLHGHSRAAQTRASLRSPVAAGASGQPLREPHPMRVPVIGSMYQVEAVPGTRRSVCRNERVGLAGSHRNIQPWGRRHVRAEARRAWFTMRVVRYQGGQCPCRASWADGWPSGGAGVPQRPDRGAPFCGGKIVMYCAACPAQR